MKKSNIFILLAFGALGVMAFSKNFSPVDKAQMSCCSGVMSEMAATNADASADVSVKPDLLTTCPVSGDKLGGDMGKPVVIVYQGQEVKFCCASCKEDFDKDPAKYIAKIRAADKPDKK